MVIEGRSILLRHVRAADVDWLYERMNDMEARGPYFPIFLQSETAYRRRFEEDGFWTDERGTLLICDAQTRAILGTIVFFRATPYWDAFEIGYRLLDLSHGSRGIMTEALMLFSYVLFSATSVHRLELKIVPDNIASRRVAEKCGYQLEGTAREAWLHRGHHYDMLVYSLLRPEGPASLAEALARLPQR